jgi:hypothetical protein
MPEFHLDTSGCVSVDVRLSEGRVPGTAYPMQLTTWEGLDAFTQGYIEALFFTEGDEPGTFDGQLCGFDDLDPATLAGIMADCAKFQGSAAWCARWNAPAVVRGEPLTFPDDAQGGRDFLYTRNGHGCGFWDGDWPEPYDTALTEAAKAFPSVDAYLGDDGHVYLS